MDGNTGIKFGVKGANGLFTPMRINNENIGRQNETLARQIKEKVKRAEQIEQRAIKREKIISKRNLKKASNRRNYLAQSFGYD